MNNLDTFITLLETIYKDLVSGNLVEWIGITGTSYTLIMAAEIGDKSQLVCIALAARHRALPIILGATCAFAFLNTLAVTFGIAIAHWVPDYWLSGTVALLFAAFGIHAFLNNEDDDEDGIVEKKGHSIFISTFLVISIAEFGDKTQLAVVALSSTALPAAVWLGSTLALLTTTCLGVYAGRSLLKKITLRALHQISGIIFIMLAVAAAWNAYDSYIALH